MTRNKWFFLSGSFVLLTVCAYLYPQDSRSAANGTSVPETIAFRILLGVGDAAPTQWDGSLSLAPGRVARIRGWRFAGDDAVEGTSAWKASTRHSAPRTGLRDQAGPILENGIIASLTAPDPAARLSVKSSQGDFTFAAREVPFGPSQAFLNGRVLVERVPDTVALTTSPEEQDFPAIAQTGDEVYVSFVQFVHGNRDQERPGPLTEAPKNFDYLARPSGGDQVFLLSYAKASRTWEAPVPVSAPGQDVMRTAVAVDGRKRVWVFWSAGRDGSFDIYAKSFASGRWSSEMRLTSDPGTDLNPVAATDAKGRVWVAWQGFRKNNLEILATMLDGDRFLPETVVSFSPASDWDPAIAAAPNGEVAIAWDTYDKGNYDVYFRRLHGEGGIRMDPPLPVAASPNFEARASIAYDGQSRLWVAYEDSSAKWGKDFGAYETSGVALYQGRNLRVKCFQGANAFELPANLAEALPAAPRETLGGASRRPAQAANPNQARNLGIRPPDQPLNSFPRIAVDKNGTVYLAFRTPLVMQAIQIPSGTIWFERVTWFDGTAWKPSVLVPDTDGWLDNRPALASIAPGELLLVATGEHRQSAGPRAGGDRINADLFAADLRIEAGAGSAQLKALPAERPAPPDREAMAEKSQVAALRDYRATLGSQKLRLMRGEFHRHTDMSGDGGRDGPIVDAYRYFIDGAAMDWGGCCDHANGGREYSWWIQQKMTDAYKLGTNFVPMFSYERSVVYPEGHRNVVFPKRGIRVLPQLPISDPDKPASAPDTQMLYRYLRQFDGIVASHTSATNMGTDWRDNDPAVEPVVEIYQGDRQNYEMPEAPRANASGYSLGGWRPLGFVSLALKKGYKLGFQASSDHISTHISYCNLWVTEPTREAIMEAFHKRRIYGATDNIMADVRCGSHFMGEEFSSDEPPAISVKLSGTAEFAKVHIIKDGEYVYSTEPKTKNVNFVWKDAGAKRGASSYYYVRGEQSDGELVWVSPMWITYR